MSAFYVGQRVRIVWSKYFPEFIGAETTIAGPLREWAHAKEGGTYFGYTLAIHPDIAVRPDQIEPILYDGNQLVSWSECAWQPEGQAA